MGAFRRILAISGILLATVPAVASADWQLTPFIGLTFKGSTTFLDPEAGAGTSHWSLGGAVTFLGDGPLGAEGLLLYTPGFLQDKHPSALALDAAPSVVDSRAVAVMGNVVLSIPRSWNEYGLRPFLSGGLGMLSVSSTDAKNFTSFSKRLLGYNVGGGAVGFFTKRVGVRFDLRRFSTVKEQPVTPDEPISIGPIRLSYWNANIGVVLRY